MKVSLIGKPFQFLMLIQTLITKSFPAVNLSKLRLSCLESQHLTFYITILE